MTRTTLALALLSGAASAAPGGLLALRVGRAETISHGTLEHAVILVGDGKILAVGEDLPIERGIPVLERPDWVAMPGLVACHTRLGMDGRAGNSFTPQRHAVQELYARQDVWEDVLELGVTTLAIPPAGGGVPGQAVAVRPRGASAEEMVVADAVYLKAVLESNPRSKKMLRDAFEEVDEYEEDVAEEREKWEKKQERAKKRKKKDDDDDDDEDEEEAFVPEAPDPEVAPFLALRRGELSALFAIQKAADFLHLLDVIEDQEISWSLFAPLSDDVDLFQVADRVGERGLTVVLEPEITLQPASRRLRNVPAEMAAAGARVAFVPRHDSLAGYEEWLTDVGRVVAAGLPRQAGLAAVTLEPARVLGLEDRFGSLEEGKVANLVLFDGDPLEPTTRLRAVMLEGEIVHEEDRP